MYNFFKDFAGPLATLVAAVVALIVTYCFQKIEARISSRQANIASEQLKLDMFDKRYSVYSTVKSLIEYLSRPLEFDAIDQNKVRKLLTILDEGKFFFFGPTSQKFINEVLTLSQSFLEKLEKRGHINVDVKDEFEKNAIALNDDLAKFRGHLDKLPSYFADDMRFLQFPHL
jgi:hypothetical protein